MNRPAKPNKAMRRWLLRAAGSAVILGVLAWILPFDVIIDGFSRVSLVLFMAVFGAFLAGHVFAAGKWWLLLGQGLPFPSALRAHFAGLASNLTLPGVAGGDAVRAAVAQVSMKDGAKVVAGSVADRLIDMLALACLVLIGVSLLQSGQGNMVLALQVLAVFVVALVATIIVLPRILPRLWNRFPSLPARGLALRIAAAFSELGTRPILLAGTLAVSISIQGLFVFLAIQLAEAVGVILPIGAWYFAWPLAKILAVLPISLGGLGLREASLAALLTPFGAEAAQVVAAGLVWQAVLFLTGGLGALILTFTGIGWRPNSPGAAEIPNQGQ